MMLRREFPIGGGQAAFLGAWGSAVGGIQKEQVIPARKPTDFVGLCSRVPNLHWPKGKPKGKPPFSGRGDIFD